MKPAPCYPARARSSPSRRSRSGSTSRSSVREQRHQKPLIAAEQDGPRNCRRSEALADLVESGVEAAPALGIERQPELDGAVVLEVRDRDTNEREASALHDRRRGCKQPPDGGQ